MRKKGGEGGLKRVREGMRKRRGGEGELKRVREEVRGERGEQEKNGRN